MEKDDQFFAYGWSTTDIENLNILSIFQGKRKDPTLDTEYSPIYEIWIHDKFRISKELC